MANCQYCDYPIDDEIKRGRPRLYCNNLCRQMAYDQRKYRQRILGKKKINDDNAKIGESNA